MIRKISAHYIFPVSKPPVKFGIIVCSENGEILDVIDNKGVFKEVSSLEFYDGILVPGFIKTDFESDQIILERMKARQSQESALSLEDIVKWVTLDMAGITKEDHILGSFEKGKFPGVYLINKIDFTCLKLTAGSQMKNLLPLFEKK